MDQKGIITYTLIYMRNNNLQYNHNPDFVPRGVCSVPELTLCKNYRKLKSERIRTLAGMQMLLSDMAVHAA